MSEQIIKAIISGVLFLHGLGHGGAIGALMWVEARPGTDTGGWRTAKSWLFPSLSARNAKTVAIIFWTVSLIGFVAAFLSFLGILVPGDFWRQLSAGLAIISTLGIALFLGTWPAFNTLAALGVNAVVLVTQIWLPAASAAIFGR
jgi:hypothetical protein